MLKMCFVLAPTVARSVKLQAPQWQPAQEHTLRWLTSTLCLTFLLPSRCLEKLLQKGRLTSMSVSRSAFGEIQPTVSTSDKGWMLLLSSYYVDQDQENAVLLRASFPGACGSPARDLLGPVRKGDV